MTIATPPRTSRTRTLHYLYAIAANLWWTWDVEAWRLFSDLAPERWHESNHNPVVLLATLAGDELEAGLDRMAEQAARVHARMRWYRDADGRNTWGNRHGGWLRVQPACYFSLEFGLHESLPIYSGGQGVLAGDHLKSASDLNVPVVGIGLFYDHGYFRQHIGPTLYQEVKHAGVAPERTPLELAVDRDGRPIVVRVEAGNDMIRARVWMLAVGRTPLYLLDCDVEGNTQEDRKLTSRLYGDGQRIRIRQQLLLGVGGMRALQMLGLRYGVLHLQEGHSAFAPLEAARQRMVNNDLTFREAMRSVTRHTLFTTHSPVPAEHDWFTPELLEEQVQPLRLELGLSQREFLALGQRGSDDHFCMPVLAWRCAGRANAVSRAHQDVTRRAWHALWPDRAIDEVPIGHVTNGVHLPSWVASRMSRLYDDHLGPGWRDKCDEETTWRPIEQVEDALLWAARCEVKQAMLDFVLARAAEQVGQRKDADRYLMQLRESLRPEVLTIVFARRFTEYKRPDLLLHDLPKLIRIVNDPDLPVRLIFSGKSHPRDREGAAAIHEVVKLTRHPELLGKVVMLENYDIQVGRQLVQGADVWLNNPRRPEEACGTSGQKVILNGGLNLSTLDGWWREAYPGHGDSGFCIGGTSTDASKKVLDLEDAKALFKTLTEEVIPCYYRRDAAGIPRDWTARIKSSIRTLAWRFNSHRMVKQYVKQYYLPLLEGSA